MSIVEQVAPVEVLTETEQRARTLEAAALEIEVRGWARGKTCAADGSVCAGGAVLFALGLEIRPYTAVMNEVVPNAWDRLDAIWGGDGEGFEEMAWFNDNTAHSADEVTFVLRARADEIRRGL